jgi:hypothetical protein
MHTDRASHVGGEEASEGRWLEHRHHLGSQPAREKSTFAVMDRIKA